MNATALSDKKLTPVDVRDRFSNEIKFTAQVECAPDAPLGWRLRLAFEWAVKHNADLSSANLSSADLSSANLSSADLRYTNLHSADLSSANLSSANLSYADLSSANLSSADLRYANLHYANLSSANLRYADLRYTNLSSASLRSADLGSANLRYANLSSANLSSANLRYADLSSADLSSASVREDKVARIVAIVERLNDPYRFIAMELEGGGLKVLAGCRWFTVAEFKAHVADDYPATAKAAETLDILAFISARAKAAGVSLKLPKPTVAA
jgi:uncharacterized protein YjbI with pentapeptide repeats